jgi:hypothetical protein
MSNVLVAGGALGRTVKEEKVVESKSGLLHSTFLGTGLGFAAGAANGGILLAYVPQTAATFTQGALVVLICGLGWAMYGAIIGGTGILSR